MYHDFDESVDVVAVFEGRVLRPLRFRWKGNRHKIIKVTNAWRAHKGDDLERHFACLDSEGNAFELAYNDRRTDWRLLKLWVE